MIDLPGGGAGIEPATPSMSSKVGVHLVTNKTSQLITLRCRKAPNEFYLPSTFVAGAKENLTSLGVAFPPRAGIEFKVRWP
jgi:hypothetical protein